MELVKSHEGKQTSYFIPHHSVFKDTGTTKEARVVFDGSAKTSNGFSTKDIFQMGPNFQQDLYFLYCGSEPVSCASQLTYQSYNIRLIYNNNNIY